MPRAARTGSPFNLYLPPERKAALEALAAANGRSLHDEIRHAVARHLAAPPVLTTPPLDVPLSRLLALGLPGAQKSPR